MSRKNIILLSTAAAMFVALVVLGAWDEERRREECRGQWDQTEGECVIEIKGE